MRGSPDFAASGRTHTHTLTNPGLTSTEVENCNLLSQLSQLQNCFLTSWLYSNFDFFSVGSYQCHLWQFLISDQFKHPKSIKQPKTLFLAHFAIFILRKCIFKSHFSYLDEDQYFNIIFIYHNIQYQPYGNSQSP